MRRAARAQRSARGQAVVEFAMVIGLFIVIVGGIVQFGVIFWTQNTITEIARDTARYAVTLSDSPCDPEARPEIATAADRNAREAVLVNYRAGTWASAGQISLLGNEGVGVDWDVPTGFPEDCPPSDNRLAVDVRVRINHVVPIFVPGLQVFAPPCSSNGYCLSTEVKMRMEPKNR